MTFTKVRFEDLSEQLKELLDLLATHRHDGVELENSTPGENRVDFYSLKNIPQEIINSASLIVVGEVPTPAPDGTNRFFYLNSPILDNNKEAIYLHGRRLSPVDDYTVDEDEIEFVVAPIVGTKILVDYQPVIE